MTTILCTIYGVVTVILLAIGGAYLVHRPIRTRDMAGGIIITCLGWPAVLLFYTLLAASLPFIIVVAPDCKPLQRAISKTIRDHSYENN